MTEISAGPALGISQILTPMVETNPEALSEMVSLNWHDRQRSRQRVLTDHGTELRLALPRGTVLKHGDLLYQDHHRQIWVEAQSEPVLQIELDSPRQLARVAHHLGNWHRSAQLLNDSTLLVYPDPPLEAWLHHQQIRYQNCLCPFEPNLTGHGHG